MSVLITSLNVLKVESFQLETKFLKLIKINDGEEGTETCIDITLNSNDEETAIYICLSKIQALQLAKTLELLCDQCFK